MTKFNFCLLALALARLSKCHKTTYTLTQFSKYAPKTNKQTKDYEAAGKQETKSNNNHLKVHSRKSVSHKTEISHVKYKVYEVHSYS